MFCPSCGRPLTSGTHKATPRRQPSVRIVRHRTIPRAARISLVATPLAAVALFLLWQVWQADDTEIPRQRTLTQKVVKYRCEAGHVWNGLGRVEPPACATCGKPAYPVGSFVCQDHGTFEAEARFANGPDGIPRLFELRLLGKEWVPADPGVECPRCGRLLLHQREDPLRGFTRNRKRSGE